MSVYIKDMEMPKDGGAVVLVISNENGETMAEVDKYCGAVYESVYVPPHGRLIDADALKDEWKRGDGDNDYEKAWITTVRRSINAAPTVLEAEGKE